VSVLPSWRPGPARDALLAFLDAAPAVPVADRLALFDNDGTLWCERPTYAQFDFFLDALRRRVADDPDLATRAEFAAVLSGDGEQLADLGLPRIAAALAGMFAGDTPEAFRDEVRAFMNAASHATGRPLRRMIYQPMLELIGDLRALDFTIGVVTGGGTEFVRAISADLYGVPPELVVGTLIGYEMVRDTAQRPTLHRGTNVLGDANEGAPKVTNIQTQLGRRPLLAAGNSGGDREMLEWTCAAGQPALALLIDHDDADREYAYASQAATFTEDEPITAVGARLGWTVVSMARDWDQVFP
jgi:hypothetical protein